MQYLTMFLEILLAVLPGFPNSSDKETTPDGTCCFSQLNLSPLLARYGSVAWNLLCS